MILSLDHRNILAANCPETTGMPLNSCKYNTSLIHDIGEPASTCMRSLQPATCGEHRLAAAAQLHHIQTARSLSFTVTLYLRPLHLLTGTIPVGL
ncbi:unnamed protein product [Arctia plantaginis]|uniref:Uncharacterized protein n=1 Tax=Arctia plantaginis TaxID=874455 RepID=A0A8S0ZV16_ARCPL|nr:unnamed protein product [Arctia plantaginis]